MADGDYDRDDDELDIPELRPRMGRRIVREPPLRLAIFRRLAATATSRRAPTGKPPAPERRRRHDIRPALAGSRRCVVKARYVSTLGSGAKAARAHLAYIERDGVEQDGSQGRLFDRTGDIDREEFGADIPGEKRQFRFIVAPEDGNELDLRAYTTRLMDRMERDLGRPLRWAAVCHYNTDNPHVHIVVRGVDERGSEVRIDRGYISEGLRLRGQEIATLELGPRTELDLHRQRSRDIAAERLTAIDRRLASQLSPQLTLDAGAIANTPNLPRPEALARLATLERLQLAERLSATSWRLAEGWQESLRQLGERGDIIKRIHRALEGRSVPFAVFEPRDGVHIEGVVRRKGLHDEQSGVPYAIIQTPRNEAVYVRLDHATAAELKEGAIVRLSCSRQPWLKATDEILRREAHANFGIYSPTVHLRKLEERPLVIGGRPVRAEEVIAVNLRRLERLARYKLVTKRPDGTWFVPPNLVATLRERERTHPRFRLRVEPLHPGLERMVEQQPPELGRKAELRLPELGRNAEPLPPRPDRKAEPQRPELGRKATGQPPELGPKIGPVQPARSREVEQRRPEVNRTPKPPQPKLSPDSERLQRAPTRRRGRGPSFER